MVNVNTVLHAALSTTNGGIATPIARLHSVSTMKAPVKNNWKLVHFIRHAEGTHNVNKDYKNPSNLDAALTVKGIEQCRTFASMNVLKKKWPHDIQCIIASPMARALQTARYCFEDLLFPNPSETNLISSIPIIASEDWRETVNYLCDKRHDLSIAKNEFPFVDFNGIKNEEDPIWAKYESIFGSADEHKLHRESDDFVSLEERIRGALSLISNRSETSIAVVSHSAFFIHMFNPYHEQLIGLIEYCDEDVEAMMRPKFENCECRSVYVEIL